MLLQLLKLNIFSPQVSCPSNLWAVTLNIFIAFMIILGVSNELVPSLPCPLFAHTIVSITDLLSTLLYWDPDTALPHILDDDPAIIQHCQV